MGDLCITFHFLLWELRMALCLNVMKYFSSSVPVADQLDNVNDEMDEN